MSWKGFMNRLVVGKKKGKDYSHGDLPSNRRQVFKFAYKQRWLTLFNANLLSLLFILPYILLEVIIYISGMKGAEISVSQKNSELMSMFLLRLPLMALASLGIAGMVYVIRKICWDETLNFKKDFFRGIKTSGKQFAEIGALLAVCMYILEAVFNLYNDGEADFLRVYITFTVYFLVIVTLIVAIYHMGLCSTYNIGFWASLKSAILLTFKRMFYNILMIITAILPVAVWFMIPFTTTYFIGLTILIFGGLSFSVLTCFLFTNKVFDDFINKNEYPEYVNKGIYLTTDEPIRHSEEEINALAELLASDYTGESEQENQANEQTEEILGEEQAKEPFDGETLENNADDIAEKVVNEEETEGNEE